MQDLFEVLSVVALAISILLFISVLLLSLVLKIRRRFPVTVNCWFCNQWTKVPYERSNSFECPTCLQYNGFDEDGGYNKVIPEQHSRSLNQQTFTPQNVPANAGPKLCKYCNNNQELKIYQLANFVPLSEDNYDIEIEHFQKQLENSYKLCPKCDKLLKNTLMQQNAWLLGKKMFTMKKEALKVFVNNNKSLGEYLTRSIQYGLIFLTATMIFNTLSEINTAHINIPKPIRTYSLLLQDFYIVCTNVLKDFSRKTPINEAAIFLKKTDVFNYLRNTTLSVVGIFLHIILMILHENRLKWVQLTAWFTLNAAVFSVYEEYLIKIFLKLFLAVFVMTTLISTPKVFKKKKIVLKKHKEFYREPEYFDDAFNEHNKNAMEDTFIDKPEDDLNASFVTASCGNYKDTSVPKETLSNSSFNNDINKSFNNLRLGNYSPKSNSTNNPFVTNCSYKSKPILWPAKLDYTQNSWLAGGFWHYGDGFSTSPPPYTNLSRSSSQSSGFLSQGSERIFYNSLPTSRNNSVAGDFERASILSEPPYFNNTTQRSHRFSKPQVMHHSFLNTNQMIYFTSSSPNVQIFDSSSFKPVFSKTSSLFKPYLTEETTPVNWAERMGQEKLHTFSDLHSSVSGKLNLS